VIERFKIKKVLFWIEIEICKLKSSRSYKYNIFVHEWNKGYIKGLESVRDLLYELLEEDLNRAK